MPEDWEWGFLEALWKGIKEGFRRPRFKRGRGGASQSRGSRIVNSLIVLVCLGLLIGGTFALLALGWSSRIDQGQSSVGTFFLIGAGIGTLIGLVYVIRCWVCDDDV